MRNAGRLVLGFYPLPETEAKRIRKYLCFPGCGFSALDPCVGDGVAFDFLTTGTQAHRYGIELDTWRAQEAAERGIAVIQGDALEVHCPPESLSLLYLNPPYDFEVGAYGNRRFEELFLRHTYRWLKRGGVLAFVIPQQQLIKCAPLLAEYFSAVRVYRLTEPQCTQYRQVAIFALRRTIRQNTTDRQYRAFIEDLERMAETDAQIPALADTADALYQVPPSGPATLTNRGIPLDVLEDRLHESNAYRQAARVLLRQPNVMQGRPITQLHGGHVALLAASGALNGVFGSGADRHMANWTPAKMFHHSIQKEEDGTVINRKWSSYSPKLLLLYEDGRTTVLSHRKSRPEADDDGQHEIASTAGANTIKASNLAEATRTATATKPTPRRTVRRRINLHKA